MYTAFYGLREKPFALSPDPRFLFMGESHRDALAHLLYGIDQGEGFISITGEVGTGKTTLCRTLLQRFGSETEIAFLFNPSRTATELLQAIAEEFGLPSMARTRHELGVQLNKFLLDKKREGRRVLLIIDEAQNLTDSTLEQVRLLSNLETSSSKLIQILLLGQPELDRKLDSPQLRQLRQRISVRCGLAPLGARETAAYVRHRLRVAAGGPRDVFSPAALREIHKRSRGVPRIVNVLCDRTLLAGYAAQARRIGPALVKQCAREIPDTRTRLVAAPRWRSGALRWVGGLVLSALVGGGAFVATSGSLSSDRLGRMLTGAPSLEIATSDARRHPLEAEMQADGEIQRGAIESASQVPDVASAPPEAAARSEVLGESGGISPLPDFLTASRDPAPLLSQPSEPFSRPAEAVTFGPILAGEHPATTRRIAANAILESYGLPPLRAAPVSRAEALDRLSDRGLQVLSLADADLATLSVLNHPALLPIRTSLGDERLVALLRLDDEEAVLSSTEGAGTLRVPAGDLSRRWSGEAFVVWQAFELIDGVLTLGERGRSVLWLQRALAELGFYGGESSGLFDFETMEGVRALQYASRLDPDGDVGPRTQMVLYDRLERYQVPRLARRDGSG